MTPKLTRIARLKQFQAERGLRGPAELGRAIGRKTNQASDLLHGRAAFGERVARAIEEVAGLPPGWLDRAEADARPPPQRAAQAVGDDVVAVGPLPDAAGARAAVRAPLLLARSWLHMAAPDAYGELRYLHVPDDSMAPLLARGDLLLVDCGVRRFHRDGVYVVHARERLLVRQLRVRLDGRLEVSAGGAAGATGEVIEPAALKVIGQALWVWRGQPL